MQIEGETIQHLNSQPAVPGRVVVLGATGFVGAELIRQLEGWTETVALSSADVDLTDPESVAQLKRLVLPDDALIVVSAITPDKGRDIATLMRNMSMGQHVSAFLETTPCSHLVYISSDAVYADDANPVREDSCCDPSSFHGLMHLVRERMFAAAAQSSTPYLILRPCAIYGAGDTHNSYGPNRFLRTALEEYRIKVFGQGEEKRDHIYVKDLSRLVALCLQHRSRGLLNVATGTSVSFYEAATIIGDLFPDHVEIEGSPRANPVTHRHFDITATAKTFPAFHYTDLRDGLAETLSGMKAGNESRD